MTVARIRSLVIAFAFVASLSMQPRVVSAQARVLHIGLIEQPNSLDPLHATQFYENYLNEAIFSALVVIDDRGNVSPDLAERVPTRANGDISVDGKTLTYRLRAGVRWSDGVPLTAADVAYTYARMMDPTSNFPQTTTYAAIARLETPNDRTVIVKLKAPWADATNQLFVGGQGGSIVPKHVLERERDLNRSAFESQPIGSGPYRVERWERGTRIVLAANETYFRGKPAIDHIDIDFIPDSTTLGIRLRTGEIDFSPQLLATTAQQLRTLPRLRFASVPTYTALQLEFNTKRSPFDDVRVRRALALALDRKRIVQTAYHGLAVVAEDLVPPQSSFYTRDPALTPSGDSAKAAILLDAAGWRIGADGLRHRGSTTLSAALYTPTGYVEVGAAAIAVQATWHALGIDATIRTMQSNLLYSPDGPLARGNYSVSLTTFGYATSPDRSQNFASGAIAPNGLNYSRTTDPALDREIFAARSEGDERRRAALYRKISATILHRAILVPLLWKEDGYLYDAALLNLRPETVNSDMWNAYAWRWK